jgi:hypothetical protein
MVSKFPVVSIRQYVSIMYLVVSMSELQGGNPAKAIGEAVVQLACRFLDFARNGGLLHSSPEKPRITRGVIQ